MESIVTVTPHENARVVVDGIPIRETYMLENQAAIILGQVNVNNNSWSSKIGNCKIILNLGEYFLLCSDDIFDVAH